MTEAIRGVTFDFYQTLVHHRFREGGRGRALRRYFDESGLMAAEWQHQVLYDVFEAHDREYSPRDTPEKQKAHFTRLTRRLFERLGMDSEQVDPRKHADEIWGIIGPNSLRVYADVMEALRGLREHGYRLAVISNWHCGLEHFCAELDLEQYFEAVIASAECGVAKPDPRIFELAAERLDLPVNRVLHVGDSPHEDVAGAEGVGMGAVLLDRSAPLSSKGVMTDLRQLSTLSTWSGSVEA